MISPDTLSSVLAAVKTGALPLTDEMYGSPNVDTLSTLNKNELDELELLGKGYSNKEIGYTLDLSEQSAKNYVTRLKNKLNCNTRTQLALLSLTLFDPESIYTEQTTATMEDEEAEDSLTHRQFQVLAMAASSLSAKQIAKKLGISAETVAIHLGKIHKKLNGNTFDVALHLLKSNPLYLTDDTLNKIPSKLSDYHLTPRELEVFELMQYGHVNEGIANKLGLSPKTISFMVTCIKEKVEYQDRLQAAMLSYLIFTKGLGQATEGCSTPEVK